LKVKYPQKIGKTEAGIRGAIKDCCTNMLRPPMRNIGLSGIQKWADTVLRWPEQFRGLDLIGCFLNTFVYIEVGGTGGSAFRTMYAKFLEEASTIVNEPALNEAAGMFRESGRVWSEVAKSALPDSWPKLQRIRELTIQKNRCFEEQELNALEKMKKITAELEDLMKKAAIDLQ